MLAPSFGEEKQYKGVGSRNRHGGCKCGAFLCQLERRRVWGRGECQVSAHLGFSVADQPQMEGRRSCVKASGQSGDWSVITGRGGQREALLGFRALQTSIQQRYWFFIALFSRLTNMKLLVPGIAIVSHFIIKITPRGWYYPHFTGEKIGSEMFGSKVT